MTQQLRFVLDGDDRLSPVLNNAGDASARLHRRLDDDMDGNAVAVRQFTTDANGRLRDLRGRFVSVADAQRQMGDGMPTVTRRLGDLAGAGGDAASSLGRSGGGLGGTMMGVAAVAGLSLLPAIGALVPMMAGAGLAAGTLKLGFSGVSEAVALAGEDTEKYNEALKKMGPEQRAFTEAVVDLKKEFSGVGKEVQKAMLPGFTKAVKEAGPLVDILGDSMTELGGSFGDAAEGVGRILKDSGFQDDLQTNLRLGNQFVRDMTSSMGPFTRSLLDFGAASGPTLTAFSDGLSGLLSKGLPGMFEGLKSGIGGSAEFLDGLFDSINDVLPAIGRFAGAVAETFGPLFGESFRVGGSIVSGTLDMMGRSLKIVEPIARDVGYGLRTIMDVGRIVAPTFGDVGRTIADAFAPVGKSVDGAVGPLQRLNRWVAENKMAVLEGARVFGHSMISMVDAALQASPTIIRAFALAANGILLAIGGIANAAAAAFSWIPGLGDKIKGASNKFDEFRTGFVGSLDKAANKADEFANSVRPKLAAGQLKLDINNWTAQLAEAKNKLKTVPPSKRAELTARIRDLQDKVDAGKRKLAELKNRSVSLSARDGISGKARAAYQAVQALHSKSIVLTTEHRTVYTGKGGRGANAYADGGTPRAGELAMVGEEGPELVVFGQSARVFDAKTTASILRGSAGAGVAASQGLSAGLGSTAGVYAAARGMAGAVTAGIRDELEIRSPSKKTKALAADVAKGFLEGLTGSRDKIKSASKDLVKDIRTAFSGKKESSLVRMVDQQTKKLLAAATKRDAIAKKIAEAKAFRDTVMNTARGTATLSGLGIEDDQVTAGGIKGAMGDKLAKIKQFTGFIKSLASRGLNKTLLRQILEMGPEAGYAYANALAGADKGTLTAINKTQYGLDVATRQLGEIGADRLYDSGKNASKGFLKGLESQEKSIEALMMKIAKGMQKSIKKALGIKSPSTVMAKLGEFSTEGLARGLVDGMPALDRSLATVSDRVSGIQPVIGRAAVAGRGGGTVIQIQIDGALDPQAVARQVRTMLLTLKRDLGGGDLGIA